MKALEVESLPSGRSTDDARKRQALIRYYSEAGPDFGAWSEAFNMHFGFYRKGLNPLDLELLLDELNHQVVDRLRIEDSPLTRLLDMGCGLGATARHVAARYGRVEVTGITIVPWQVERARELTADANLGDRVRFLEADYTATGYDDESFDGLCAIESSCYATGHDKHDFIQKAHRVLRPGGRLVVADGFLKTTAPLNRFVDYCYKKVCECWVLEEFAEIHRFEERLQSSGFVDVRVEEISWNIVPSLLHIPRVACKFLWGELVSSRSRMTRVRRNHVIAPVLLPFIGLARRHVGYFLVTARKGQRAEGSTP